MNNLSSFCKTVDEVKSSKFNHDQKGPFKNLDEKEKDKPFIDYFTASVKSSMIYPRTQQDVLKIVTFCARKSLITLLIGDEINPDGYSMIFKSTNRGIEFRTFICGRMSSMIVCDTNECSQINQYFESLMIEPKVWYIIRNDVVLNFIIPFILADFEISCFAETEESPVRVLFAGPTLKEITLDCTAKVCYGNVSVVDTIKIPSIKMQFIECFSSNDKLCIDMLMKYSTPNIRFDQKSIENGFKQQCHDKATNGLFDLSLEVRDDIAEIHSSSNLEEFKTIYQDAEKFGFGCFNREVYLDGNQIRHKDDVKYGRKIDEKVSKEEFLKSITFGGPRSNKIKDFCEAKKIDLKTKIKDNLEGPEKPNIHSFLPDFYEKIPKTSDEHNPDDIAEITYQTHDGGTFGIHRALKKETAIRLIQMIMAATMINGTYGSMIGSPSRSYGINIFNLVYFYYSIALIFTLISTILLFKHFTNWKESNVCTYVVDNSGQAILMGAGHEAVSDYSEHEAYKATIMGKLGIKPVQKGMFMIIGLKNIFILTILLLMITGAMSSYGFRRETLSDYCTRKNIDLSGYPEVLNCIKNECRKKDLDKRMRQAHADGYIGMETLSSYHIEFNEFDDEWSAQKDPWLYKLEKDTTSGLTITTKYGFPCYTNIMGYSMIENCGMDYSQCIAHYITTVQFPIGDVPLCLLSQNGNGTEPYTLLKVISWRQPRKTITCSNKYFVSDLKPTFEARVIGSDLTSCTQCLNVYGRNNIPNYQNSICLYTKKCTDGTSSCNGCGFRSYTQDDKKVYQVCKISAVNEDLGIEISDAHGNILSSESWDGKSNYDKGLNGDIYSIFAKGVQRYSIIDQFAVIDVQNPKDIKFFDASVVDQDFSSDGCDLSKFGYYKYLNTTRPWSNCLPSLAQKTTITMSRSDYEFDEKFIGAEGLFKMAETLDRRTGEQWIAKSPSYIQRKRLATVDNVVSPTTLLSTAFTSSVDCVYNDPFKFYLRNYDGTYQLASAMLCKGMLYFKQANDTYSPAEGILFRPFITAYKKIGNCEDPTMPIPYNPSTSNYYYSLSFNATTHSFDVHKTLDNAVTWPLYTCNDGSKFHLSAVTFTSELGVAQGTNIDTLKGAYGYYIDLSASSYFMSVDFNLFARYTGTENVIAKIETKGPIKVVTSRACPRVVDIKVTPTVVVAIISNDPKCRSGRISVSYNCRNGTTIEPDAGTLNDGGSEQSFTSLYRPTALDDTCEIKVMSVEKIAPPYPSFRVNGVRRELPRDRETGSQPRGDGSNSNRAINFANWLLSLFNMDWIKKYYPTMLAFISIYIIYVIIVFITYWVLAFVSLIVELPPIIYYVGTIMYKLTILGFFIDAVMIKNLYMRCVGLKKSKKE